MFRYIVQCEFKGDDDSLVKRWLEWLFPKHIQDVIDCGAISGEVIRLEGANPIFAIHYTFPDKSMFEKYEKEHAPRLREEGKSLFPHELGLVYTRSTGEVIGCLETS